MKIVYTIALILFFIVALTACGEPKFNGNRTGNESQFLMDYSVFTGSDFQLLKLKEGDKIDVEIVSESGRIDIEVKMDNREPIYTGNAATGSFKLTVTESGIYKCSVTGKNAKGSLSFVK
ncbi:hypothetical protein [Clostridium sp.]|uniref:hypothetical protein n=1 Tax=Clostridium sp. TaxID=1506 RepID=UPI003F2C4CFB